MKLTRARIAGMIRVVAKPIILSDTMRARFGDSAGLGARHYHWHWQASHACAAGPLARLVTKTG